MTFHEDLFPTILRDTTQGAVAGVAALNNAEYHALRGYAFRAVIRDALAVGAVKWLRVIVGSKGLLVLRRVLMPDIAGIEYELFTGTSGFSVSSTITPYNVDWSLTSNVATSTWSIITTPTTAGTSIDSPIFIGAGNSAGASGRPAGTGDGDDTYDYYPPDSILFARFNNRSGVSNYFVMRYLFAEV